MSALQRLILMIAILVAGAAALVYGGAVNVAADEPHWAVTSAVLTLTRERSIAVRSRDLRAPDLEDESLIALGAEHYAEMCTGCHLAPGQGDSELRQGLNPQPPSLLEHGKDLSPEQAFWVIKHGIRMTAMPAWGSTHDDRSIWGLVAFVRKLPGLAPDAYREWVERGGEGHHHDEEHGAAAHDEMDAEHEHGEHHEEGEHHHDAPGRPPEKE